MIASETFRNVGRYTIRRFHKLFADSVFRKIVSFDNLFPNAITQVESYPVRLNIIQRQILFIFHILQLCQITIQQSNH